MIHEPAKRPFGMKLNQSLYPGFRNTGQRITPITGHRVFAVVCLGGLFALAGCAENSGPRVTDDGDQIETARLNEPKQNAQKKLRESTQPMSDDSMISASTDVDPESHAGDVASEPHAKDASDLTEIALTALQKGDDEAAYRAARQLMRIDPDEPDSQYVMALVFGHRRRFAEAIDMLDSVAKLKPEAKLPALGQTADWMVRAGNWKQAEERYREIVDLAPNAAMPLRNLARLLSRQGRRIEAAKYWFNLCKIGDVTEFELRNMLSLVHPFRGDAVRWEAEVIGVIGRVRNEISQQQLDEAQKRLEFLDPRSIEQQSLLAHLYAASGSIESLQSLISKLDEKEASATAATRSDYWYASGVLAVETGDNQFAIDCLNRCVLDNPTDVSAYQRLASVYESQGQKDVAQRCAERAKLIARTHEIGSVMAESAQRDGNQLSTLVDDLIALNRPLEALAWRGVQISYARQSGALPDSQASQLIQSLSTERKRLLQSGQFRPSEDFILCGAAAPKANK